jgi:NADH-quinone oxidoreductase subunit C
MSTLIERVDPQEALDRAESLLGARVRDLRLNHGQIDLVCDTADFVSVVTALRDDELLKFDFFTFLSAIDRSEFGGSEKEDDEDPERHRLEVLVHLYSPSHAIHVNIHVPVSADEPVCPSITSLFAGANWHERETAEMFGIDFEGHPRLVNLYLPEDFEGNPLRRSFKLPSRQIKEWPGAKDPEEAAAGGR